VPVVSTAVGAEGIGDEDLYAALVDDEEGLVEGLCTVLSAPELHQARADQAQRWAIGTYGREQFHTAIRAVIGKRPDG
jgi:hypothetical protein